MDEEMDQCFGSHIGAEDVVSAGCFPKATAATAFISPISCYYRHYLFPTDYPSVLY